MGTAFKVLALKIPQFKESSYAPIGTQPDTVVCRERVAATRIQLWALHTLQQWRAWRRSAMYLYPLRQSAASKIQRAVRCHRARCDARDAHSRSLSLALLGKMDAAASLLQGAWFAHVSRQALSKNILKRREVCVIAIQSVYRGHLARGEARRVRKRQREERREAKAIAWASITLQVNEPSPFHSLTSHPHSDLQPLISIRQALNSETSSNIDPNLESRSLVLDALHSDPACDL